MPESQDVKGVRPTDSPETCCLPVSGAPAGDLLGSCGGANGRSPSALSSDVVDREPSVASSWGFSFFLLHLAVRGAGPARTTPHQTNQRSPPNLTDSSRQRDGLTHDSFTIHLTHRLRSLS